MATGVVDRLWLRLEHDADRIESRWRILPERVVRLRAHGDLDGSRHVGVLGDGHRLLMFDVLVLRDAVDHPRRRDPQNVVDGRGQQELCARHSVGLDLGGQGTARSTA